MTRSRRRMRKRRRWTREALLDEMRSRAARGEKPGADPYLYNAVRRHFTSFEEAANLAGIPVRRLRRRTRAETIRALRLLAQQHPVITDRLVVEDRLRAAVIKHFGTLSAACRAAGVDSAVSIRERARASRDTPDRIVRELQAIARTVGGTVTARDVPHPLMTSILRVFGSMPAARSAARLPEPKRNTRWTRASVLEELREEHARGTRITEPGLTAAGRHDLVDASRRLHGGVSPARRRAGIAYRPLAREVEPFVRVWDRDRVLSAIRARARRGESLASSKVGRPLQAAAIRYCGSWRAAIEGAGFAYHDIQLVHRYSNAQLFTELRRLAREQPTMTVGELRKEPIGAVLYVRFGNPEEAARRAKIRNWPIRKVHPILPRDEVRRRLLEHLKRSGSLARVSVQRDDPTLLPSIRRVHPVWKLALRRLRLPIDAH